MERKDAYAQQLRTYDTGRPCRNGHLTYRYTISGSCSECVKISNTNRGSIPRPDRIPLPRLDRAPLPKPVPLAEAFVFAYAEDLQAIADAAGVANTFRLRKMVDAYVGQYSAKVPMESVRLVHAAGQLCMRGHRRLPLDYRPSVPEHDPVAAIEAMHAQAKGK